MRIAATIASTAKYIFTTIDGFTGLCTGTLISDTVPTSQIPYFLTANHCIESQSEASSTEYYWFFERTSCGGSIPSDVVRQTGGADLLATIGSTDTALLRLRSSLPEGAGFSGWTTRSAENKAVAGIHHPRGDLKKGSLGNTSDFVTVNASNSHIQTTWSNGTTEPGSSGSGIWFEENGQHYLVGSLTGGRASCDNLSESDYYGRFDVAFASLSSYLAPDDDTGDGSGTTGGLVNISSNGMVDKTGVSIGFIVRNSAKRFAITARGRGLSDPQLVLSHPDGSIIHQNDDWRSDETSQEIVALLSDNPLSDFDAAFLITLEPGVYILKASGVNGSVGRAITSVTEVTGD
uniref:Lysyl endopeptidase (EC) n=1 Tax=uncultured Thiotrichaceae bacterium TaxID=298394 RepID=A0A6S6U7Z1_9GAMM|nr:MAG: Lysyl endopeptidase (EC [uncultured Thiotrichaceae bacterium]